MTTIRDMLVTLDSCDASATRLEFAALASGRPTRVVPYAGRFTGPPRKILVAWNGSREACRAVNDAMPFLRAAQSVTVLAVDPEGGRRHGEAAGADIAQHLAR